MHKRTAHALVDSDDGADAFLQDSLEPSSLNKSKKKAIKETVSMMQIKPDLLITYFVRCDYANQLTDLN